MTRLTGVTVEGFKGIDRIKFDPGRLNVVTGRNNSGKTSLLEALHLAYEPTSIARFGSNLDTLVNQQYEEAVIGVETTEKDLELRLEQPEVGAVPDILVEAFRQRLERPQQINLKELEGDSDISREIDVDIAEVIAEVSDPDQFEEAKGEVIAQVIDGASYPYVHFGPAVGALYRKVRKKVAEIIDEDITLDNSLLELANSFESGCESYNFPQGEPSALGTTNFVNFMQHNTVLRLDEDDTDPVKVDDVGDFLRDKGILEDLKTFDVDHLVFEPEDGEKYSVPFEFMGEGFKTIVGVLWELLDEEQNWDLVLLEEPETHMHPGYVRELVYFLVQIAREEDVQLFVTTHNNDFLNDFFEANFTEDEQAFLEDEFRLLQLQDGTADVMSYAEAEQDLKELKLDLRGL